MAMGKLTKKEVIKTAKLANLTLASDETEIFAKQLSKVVEYFGELNEVNTTGVEPTSQTTGLINKTRADEVNSLRIISVNDVMSGTDIKYNNYFSVPLLINKGE